MKKTAEIAVGLRAGRDFHRFLRKSIVEFF